MAQDRGELRYTIRVQDEFRDTLRRFRRQIDASKKALEGLAASRATGQGGGRRFTAEQRFERFQIRRIRRIDAEAKQRARVEREVGRIVQQRTRDELRARQAIVRAGRDIRRQGQREARLSAARIRNLNKQATATQNVAAGVRRIGRETRAVNRDGGRLLFTFRRLFGALAAFTLAREAAGSFRDLVALGIQFNAQLQLGRLGFAGLLLAAGEVRDAQGQLVKGQEAFNTALQLAGKLQIQLRQRALETTATAEELGFAFQQAIAPGLARGLDPEQILDLTVKISQAASAIGLAQNQLAEETRSIIQGTARAQTTRLAALFGGATELNKLVRSAKNADELLDSLNERLRGTSQAAALAALTVPGLFARIRDGLAFVTGTAAREFFDSIGEALKGIFNLLLITNEETQKLEPNPAVLGAFIAIFDVLNDLVDRALQFGRNVGFGGLVTGAKAFAAILQILGSFLLGIGRGIAFLSSLAASLASPFISIAGSAATFAAFLADAAEVLGGLLTTMVAIRTATFLASVAAGLFKTNMEGVAVASNLTQKSLFLMAAAIAAGVFAAQQLVNFLAGANLTLKQTALILSELILATLNLAIEAAKQFFKEFVTAKQAEANNKELAKTSDIIAESVKEMRRLRDEGSITEEQFRSFLRTAGAAQSEVGEGIQQQGDRLEDIRAERDKIFAAFDDFLGDEGRLNEILSQGAAGSTDEIADRVRDVLDRLRAELAAFDEENANTLSGKGAAEDTGLTTQQTRQFAASQRQLSISLQQAESLERQLKLQQSGATQAQIQLQVERDKLGAMIVQAANRDEELAAQIQLLDAERDGTTNAEKRNALFLQLLTLEDQRTAAARITASEIEQQNAKLREQQLIISGTVGEGLDRGLRNFAERFASAFEAGIRIAEGVLQRFSSFVSQSIVDALDPTKDFDIKERFARFLQDIAQLIIQQFIQLAIAKAVLGLSGGATLENLSINELVPLAEGGQVPGGPGYESRPPLGIPRSDTVLARLTPGEHVDPVRTVSRLGADFFERLRTGAGNPAALRALVGLGMGKRARSKVNSSGFFQAGGVVSQARQAATTQNISGLTESRSSTGIQRAIIVSSENEMEKLIAGGAPALLQFMRDNSDEIGIGQSGG